jgi:hypothetical protein
MSSRRYRPQRVSFQLATRRTATDRSPSWNLSNLLPGIQHEDWLIFSNHSMQSGVIFGDAHAAKGASPEHQLTAI